MVYIEVLLVLDVYYIMQLKYKKFKLKSRYKNNYNIHTARIKNKYLIIKSGKKTPRKSISMFSIESKLEGPDRLSRVPTFCDFYILKIFTQVRIPKA